MVATRATQSTTYMHTSVIFVPQCSGFLIITELMDIIEPYKQCAHIGLIYDVHDQSMHVHVNGPPARGEIEVLGVGGEFQIQTYIVHVQSCKYTHSMGKKTTDGNRFESY